MYRGYQITKTSNGQYIFYGTSINAFFKTEEEAMDKIDSIERERVERDNANIQRIDNQIKR
jgi:hypothetical protein